MSTYHVLNENTLCYDYGGLPFVGILSGRPGTPGAHNPQRGITVVAANDTLRPATRADFDFYRISWKGHTNAKPSPSRTSA